MPKPPTGGARASLPWGALDTIDMIRKSCYNFETDYNL